MPSSKNKTRRYALIAWQLKRYHLFQLHFHKFASVRLGCLASIASTSHSIALCADPGAASAAVQQLWRSTRDKVKRNLELQWKAGSLRNDGLKLTRKKWLRYAPFYWVKWTLIECYSWLSWQPPLWQQRYWTWPRHWIVASYAPALRRWTLRVLSLESTEASLVTVFTAYEKLHIVTGELKQQD